MTRRHLLLTAVAAAVIMLMAPPASAQNSCTIGTTSVAFGAYNVFSTTARDSTGTVWVQCTLGATVSISLGRGASSTFTPRTLTGTGGSLSYNLFKEAARTNIWGDGSAGGALPVSVTVTANTRLTRTIYGRIPASQDVGIGSYADSVVATVNF
jgi:spore coat protein U-like protein